MYRVTRSVLFKRQLLEITASYRERAGSLVALKFIDQIEDSIRFVSVTPRTCAVYTTMEGKEFRKWRVQDFPVSIFFRLHDEATIVIEALYAHKMNIATRFPDDIQ